MKEKHSEFTSRVEDASSFLSHIIGDAVEKLSKGEFLTTVKIQEKAIVKKAKDEAEKEEAEKAEKEKAEKTAAESRSIFSRILG